MRIISKADLNAYLWLGYLPHSSTNLLKSVSKLNPVSSSDRLTLADVAAMGGQIWDRIFDRCVEESNPPYVVPLSGGYDSRFLLASLLDRVPRKDILAMTFGTPGTFDYEIPVRITSKFKVQHRRIDLANLPVAWENLVQIVDSGGDWIDSLTAYYNHFLVQNIPSGGTVYSGYLGGEVAGSHYELGDENLSWYEARHAFLKRNAWFGHASNPFGVTVDGILSLLPEQPFVDDPKVLSYTEQLDLAVRQPSWIKKAIFGNALCVVTPFADPDWVAFMCTLPLSLRVRMSGYKHLLKRKYPGFFGEKTKSEYCDEVNLFSRSRCGRLVLNLRNRGNKRLLPLNRRNLPLLMENYLNFNEAFRMRSDFVCLARRAINDPIVRELVPHIDLELILRQHCEGKADWSRILMLLVSLCVNMQQAEISYDKSTWL